jgi:hypothetical protein
LIRVVSGWHPAGRLAYGSRFLASFAKHWPADVQLHVYTEEPEPMDRGVCRNVLAITGAAALLRDLGERPEACGKQSREGWKQSEMEAGYSFRYDARRFFKQLIIPADCARDMKDGDVLIWMDGDVETTAPVPRVLPDSLLGNRDLFYLGREPKHSEIGTWGVRLNDTTRAFLDALSRCYIGRGFFELREWHSAFVFDHVRGMFPQMQQRNLTPGGRGHVYPRSALAPYLRHDKGDRVKGK